MKKSVLLIAAGLTAGLAHGQEAHQSAIFQHDQFAQKGTLANLPATHEGAKATSWPGTGGGRWYDYGGGRTGTGILNSYTSVTTVSGAGFLIWNDTTAMFGYTGPVYEGNGAFTSYGLGLSPRYPMWNDPTLFPGVIGISSADAYTIDSVMVSGWYGRNNAKPGIVDTLIFAFVQGNGTSTSNNPSFYFSDATLLGNYGITSGNLNFLGLGHDSLNNRAGNILISGTTETTTPVPATQVYKFPLRVVDTNTSDFTRGTQYPRPATGHPGEPIINFPVTAGNYAAMTVTFKSGDTWPSTTLPSGYKDTVRYLNGTTLTYKYGCFQGIIDYDGTSTAASFPPYYYGAGDKTSGYFKREGAPGWGGQYLPNWAWTSGGGASDLQYPEIVFHVKCTTCNMVGNGALGVTNVSNISDVNVYPNPAASELNISFNAKTAVTVTLTNMVGQVVATSTVTNGHTTINTSSLPAGMYVYTLSANGARTTGNVAIAH